MTFKSNRVDCSFRTFVKSLHTIWILKVPKGRLPFLKGPYMLLSNSIYLTITTPNDTCVETDVDSPTM